MGNTLIKESIYMAKKVSQKTRVIRKGPRRIIECILIGIIVFLGFQIYQDVTMTLTLRREYSEAKELVASLEYQQEVLSEEILKLEDPAYVKRYARGKYMVTKEGEQVFKLPSKD